MSVRRYSLWGVGLLVACLALWLAVPEAIEWSAGQWLRGQLAERDVEWSHLEWSWRGRASMHDVSADLARPVGAERVRARLEADRLIVGIPWDVLWSNGSTSLDGASIEIQSAAVAVELKQAPTSADTEVKPVERQEPTRLFRRRLSMLRDLWFDDLPAVSSLLLTDIRFNLSTERRQLATLDGGFRWNSDEGRVRGKGKWKVPLQPRAHTGRWVVDGDREQADWAGHVVSTLTSGSGSLDEHGIDAKRMTWSVTETSPPDERGDPCPAQKVDVTLESPSMTRRPGVDFQATAVGAAFTVMPDACQTDLPVRARFYVHEPRLTLDPTAVSDAAQRAPTPLGRTEQSKSTVRRRLVDYLRARSSVIRAMTRVDIKGGRLAVSGEDEPLARDIRVQWRDQLASVAGSIGSDRFSATLSIGRRQLFPVTATWQLEHVPLDDVAKVAHRIMNRQQRVGWPADLWKRLADRVDGSLSGSGWVAVTDNPMAASFDRRHDLVTGDVDFSLDDVWVDVAGLADSKVGPVDGRLDARLESRAWPSAIELTTRSSNDRASVGTDRATLSFDLEASLDVSFDGQTPQTLELRIDLPETNCQDGFHAIPEPIWGPYRQARLSGSASPSAHLRYDIGHPSSFTFDVDGWPATCRVDRLQARKSAWPPVQIRTGDGGYRQPGAELMRDVGWLREPFALQVTEGVSKDADVLVGPGTDTYATIETLPEFVSAAAYLSEEVAFWRDGVLNLHLMERAVRMNLDERRFVYGGSTITQQLVKNLFLSRDKTLARKLREALIGWRMLDVISKNRVLELYLNCIEFGPDIYGIEQAAQHYFQRSADKLTLKQAVFLAIIKPAPWYGERFRDRGSTPKKHWWRERMGEIIARLVIHDVISRETAEQARPYVVQWDDDGTWTETPHRDSQEPAFDTTLANADADDDQPVASQSDEQGNESNRTEQ